MYIELQPGHLNIKKYFDRQFSWPKRSPQHGIVCLAISVWPAHFSAVVSIINLMDDGSEKLLKQIFTWINISLKTDFWGSYAEYTENGTFAMENGCCRFGLYVRNMNLVSVTVSPPAKLFIKWWYNWKHWHKINRRCAKSAFSHNGWRWISVTWNFTFTLNKCVFGLGVRNVICGRLRTRVYHGIKQTSNFAE